MKIASDMFEHGLRLSKLFYQEIVAGLIEEHFPGLRYSAGLLGYGSDVLGFDTETSTDHNWGPRMILFVGENDAGRILEVSLCLTKNLPAEFHGYPANFSSKGPDQTQHMCDPTGNEINHLIELHQIDLYFDSAIGAQPGSLDAFDWLRIPEQKLLEVTAGEVFYDGLDTLVRYRAELSYYPPEVRKLRLAAYWDCIANEEAFVGRMIECGDMVGLRLIVPRIVTSLLKICFILKQEYSPYSKWFSAGFRRLGLSEINRLVDNILTQSDSSVIEESLSNLYVAVLRMQNECGCYPVVKNVVQLYYGRPYKVIMAGEIVQALLDSISSQELRDLDLGLVALDGKVNSLYFTETDTLKRLL